MKSSSEGEDRRRLQPADARESDGRQAFRRRIDCAETGDRNVYGGQRSTRGHGLREGETWDLKSGNHYS